MSLQIDRANLSCYWTKNASRSDELLYFDRNNINRISRLNIKSKQLQRIAVYKTYDEIVLYLSLACTYLLHYIQQELLC